MRRVLLALCSSVLAACGIVSGLDDLEVTTDATSSAAASGPGSGGSGGAGGASCAPGALGEPCCENACQDGVACKDGTCVVCGEAGAPCCATDPACGPYLACTDGTCLGCAVAIDVGFSHTCVQKNDGTMWCWGSNLNGELGIGDYDESVHALPSQVVGLDEGIAQIGLGGTTSCAIKTNGTSWCWGYNYYGELGVGNNDPYLVPSPVQVVGLGNDTLQLAPGEGVHGCAVRPSGLYCWGTNDIGQLGIGVIDVELHVPEPVTLLGTQVLDVATGENDTCARTADGFYCWGPNSWGELAQGTIDGAGHIVPEQVASFGTNVAQFDFHTTHGCATFADGSLWCWGQNDYGQLGAAGVQPGPVEVIQLGHEVVDVRVGQSQTCALLADQTMWCWGANTVGQLGIGTTGIADHPDPLPMDLPAKVKAMAAALYHTCALTVDGRVYCWGMNDFGEVGTESAEEFVTSPSLVHLACP